ncbi:MAG: SLC13 family permease, partial [Acetatifactor sp.]|nr:SLC13 family permease [Acetatifactor sp.]
PDVEALKAIKINDIVNEEIEKMNLSQKIVLFAMVATIIGVMAPMILPTTIPGIGFLDTIGLLGVDCFLIAIAMMIRTKENKPLINLKEYAKKSFSWDIFFQVAAALYIATAITSDVTGIKTFVVETITSLLIGKPVIIFIALIVICAVLITQVANNMAMGIIFASLLTGFTADYPTVNLIALAVTAGMAVFMALLTPAASPYCSMLHARKDLVDTRDIMKVFLPATVAGILVYICLGYPLASLIFG